MHSCGRSLLQASVAFMAAGQAAGAELVQLEPAAADVAEAACGCEDSSGEDEDAEQGDAPSSCEYQAWVLPLQPGQNVFNLTLPSGEWEAADQVGASVCLLVAV